MKFDREDLEIEGGRKAYLYSFHEDNVRKQQKIWGRVGENWRNEGAVIEEWFAPVTQKMLEFLPAAPGRLLDLGCGAQSLRFPGWETVGVDAAPDMLSAGALAAVGACERLPFKNEAFDAVAARFSLMFTSVPADCMRACNRVLKPEGTFVFAVWASPEANRWSSDAAKFILEKLQMEPPGPEEPGAFRLADEPQVRGYLEGAGFTQVQSESVTVDYMRGKSGEEAATFLLKFAGPVAVGVSKFPEEHKAEWMREFQQMMAAADKGGRAVVWSAKKAP